mmetsp:Transcript_5567/g.21017  ORF Transcript_5567/g.21017 Transcript_5567/m.21017 type:complete len:211 (+) Transcript_5567:642-1274(+)
MVSKWRMSSKAVRTAVSILCTAGLNELDLIELIRGHQGRFLASGTLYGSNSVRVAVDLSVKIHRHAASKGSLEASFRLGDARSRRRMRRHNIRRRRCGLVRGRFIPCNLDNCRNRRVQPKLFRCLLLRGGRACGQAEELPRRASLIQKVVEASDDRGLFLFVAEDGGDEVHRPHQPDELLQLLGGAVLRVRIQSQSDPALRDNFVLPVPI